MKILELTLPSTDIEAQERVYSDTLGFNCQRISADELQVNCGDNVLKFVSSNRQFYYHYCFLVPPGCLNSIMSFLDQRDFEPILHRGERVIDFGNGASVYFFDGDRNLAEFIERPSLGHRPQTEFAINDVIRLNEIGIPSDDPQKSAGELIQNFDIKPVEGAVNREDFVWCGDYEGVFLIPKVGRNWLPLDKPAEANDMFVRFETDAGRFEYEYRCGEPFSD